VATARRQGRKTDPAGADHPPVVSRRHPPAAVLWPVPRGMAGKSRYTSRWRSRARTGAAVSSPAHRGGRSGNGYCVSPGPDARSFRNWHPQHQTPLPGRPAAQIASYAQPRVAEPRTSR